MCEKYSAGVVAYRVYRGRRRGGKAIGGVHRIELPKLPIPALAHEHQGMILRMYFLSALDASEAMKNAGFQTLRIRSAEEYWDVENAAIGIREVEHILRVKPRVLIPGSISGRYGAVIYRIPTESEQEPQSNINPPDYRDEVEPLSLEQTAHSSYPVCEYDVFYYAAYSEGKKMWEVCPKKRLYTIGGTRYRFPHNK